MRKRILLLGGSAQQVIAVETAKRLGYYTILCDYLPDNPGQHAADKFYLVSTTDKDAVLQVAQKERIDGVLAYASDPAAPTAAYVAEKLGLRTNPYQSVDTLCNKDKFRQFLARNGFHTPQAEGYSSKEEAERCINTFLLPVIIKPVDSSGSKGVTVLYNLEDLEVALEHAFSYSRSHRIIIEEFIEKKHPFLIGGDIFVQDGKVILWGLMNCHRDHTVNELVPVGKSFPLNLDEADICNVKKTLQDMVNMLDIQYGAMNVEVIVDKNNNVWPIDIGPRNGGNMIPDLLGMIFNIDIVEMTVRAAMGEPISSDIGEGIPFYATHNLHVNKTGNFEKVTFTDEVARYIVRKHIYKQKGDLVEYFDNAAKAIGIVFLKFDSEEEMNCVLSNINDYIKVEMMDV